MTMQWTVRALAVTLVVAGVGMIVLAFDSPVSAQPATSITNAVALSAVAAGDEPEYAGTNKCKMCHKAVYDSWEETPHAKALDNLKPGERAEVKTKHGLDPEKDYSADEACLACHTVGYGKPGGFAVEEDAKKMEKMVKNFGGIGCENCHGPGDGYKDFHKQIKKDKTEYTWDDMAKAGMTKITQETCNKCHNDKSPTFEEGKEVKLDVESRKGIHAKEDLQYRKG